MPGVNSTVVSYLGELFQSGKRPNTLLKLIGFFSGQVMETKAKVFPIGVFYNLRAPSQPSVLEGANAPAAQSRTVTQTTNNIQIHQETVSLTYLAQSDDTISGVVPIPQGKAQGSVVNPRSEAWQVQTALDTVAQDLNYSCLNGTGANPADPTATALQTRGLLTAIVTNANDHSADAVGTGATGTATDPALQYRRYVEEAVRQTVITSGYNPDETYVIMAGTTEYNNVCAAYEAKGTIYLQPESEVAGIKIRKILTRYGTLLMALDPDVPAQYFTILNLGMVGIVGMPVPGKGILFEEPLAKVGSSDQSQIYGQLGLDHAPEFLHAKTKVPSGFSL